MGALYTATTVFISKDNPVKADHVVGRFLGVVKSWQASCATSRPIIYTVPDECQPKSLRCSRWVNLDLFGFANMALEAGAIADTVLYRNGCP